MGLFHGNTRLNDMKTCSSGGVATTLYRSFLQEGGLIVGAKERGTDAPVLTITNHSEDIEHFKGSKYVYVDPQKVYKEIESKKESVALKALSQISDLFDEGKCKEIEEIIINTPEIEIYDKLYLSLS